MQPHGVKRFHLDGVTDSEEYYAGVLMGDTVDADASIEKFFEYCALAGPQNCPLWAGNTTPRTSQRLLDIYADLRNNGPIAVPGTLATEPDIITLSDVRRSTFDSLYAPLARWQAIASLLAPLTDRNGTAFAADKQAESQARLASIPEAFDPEDPSTAPSNQGTPAGSMIQGGDSSSRLTQAAFALERLLPLKKASFWTGDQWATTYMPLSTSPIKFPWRYGDAHAIASNVTAHPILSASNLYDGATSLCSARKMQAAFPGSGLLIVDGESHTTRAEPSHCNARAIM